jgi:hypothetical protein
MPLRRDKARLAAAAACCLALAAVPAAACNVPVFRYALERWEPHVYEVFIYHDKELSAADREVVDWLTKCAADRDILCNIDVRVVNVGEKMHQFIAAAYKTQAGKALPRLVVCYPPRFGPPVIAWESPLTAEAARAIVDSPVRQKVSQAIIKGESAVWVFLESGDKAKDDAAAKLLEGQFDKLEKLLEIPPQLPLYPGEPEEAADQGLPLKVAFSLVRLSRKSPGEKVLVQMLMNTEEDLASEYASEPMAFAVFGQGRAMWALVGKGINEENIIEVCAFLVGRCSCQVKDMNPGIDVLFRADWYAGLEGREPATAVLPNVIAPAAATSAPAPAPGAAAARVARAAAQAVADADAGGGTLLRNTLIAFGCLVLAAAALVVWVSRRPARN